MENFIKEAVNILANIDTSKIYTMDRIKHSGNIGFDVASRVVEALSFGECVLTTKRFNDKQVNMVYLVSKEKYINLFTIINNYPAENTVLIRIHNNSATLREVVGALAGLVEDRNFGYIYSNNKDELLFSCLATYPEKISSYMRLDKQPALEADMTLEEFKRHCSDRALMSYELKESNKYIFNKYIERGQESGLFEKVVFGSAEHILKANGISTEFTLKRYRGSHKEISVIDVLVKGDDGKTFNMLRYIYYYNDSYKYLCILNIEELRLYEPADAYMESTYNVIAPEGYTVHNSYKSGVIYKIS